MPDPGFPLLMVRVDLPRSSLCRRAVRPLPLVGSVRWLLRTPPNRMWVWLVAIVLPFLTSNGFVPSVCPQTGRGGCFWGSCAVQHNVYLFFLSPFVPKPAGTEDCSTLRVSRVCGKTGHVSLALAVACRIIISTRVTDYPPLGEGAARLPPLKGSKGVGYSQGYDLGIYSTPGIA